MKKILMIFVWHIMISVNSQAATPYKIENYTKDSYFAFYKNVPGTISCPNGDVAYTTYYINTWRHRRTLCLKTCPNNKEIPLIQITPAKTTLLEKIYKTQTCIGHNGYSPIYPHGGYKSTPINLFCVLTENKDNFWNSKYYPPYSTINESCPSGFVNVTAPHTCNDAHSNANSKYGLINCKLGKRGSFLNCMKGE